MGRVVPGPSAALHPVGSAAGAASCQTLLCRTPQVGEQMQALHTLMEQA